MNQLPIFVLCICLFHASLSIAQVPDGINYQGIARDAAGTELRNTTVGMRFTIYNGTVVEYRETARITSNSFGLLVHVVGSGTPATGNFANINWTGTPRSLSVEMDPSGGTTYSISTGTQVLRSVPYAFSSRFVNSLSNLPLDSMRNVKLASPVAGNILSYNGSNWVNDQQWVKTGSELYFNTGNVGIGNINPAARLHVSGSAGADAVLFSGTYQATTTTLPPATGAGTRLMWYPSKAAFRAGRTSGTHWNMDSIGEYSFAGGVDTKAKGIGSVAIGYMSSATGAFSTVTGYGNFATGGSSVALGRNNVASGDNGVAIGFGTEATGIFSYAFGRDCIASGTHSLALGTDASATANFTNAIGYSVTASGTYSTAIGNYASTNNMSGAVVVADGSTLTIVNSPAPQSYTSRFNGGYYLYTNQAATLGTRLIAGGNSWSVISDSSKKENFNLVHGEIILEKISKLSLGTWNYKGQDPRYFRHYGPMAQDFYAAFGKDKIGTVGCDTLINSSDFDGINLIAIQALEKRTKELQAAQESLTKAQQELKSVKSEIEGIKSDMAAMKSLVKQWDEQYAIQAKK